MPANASAVLRQPPKTCDVTSFTSCLAHQLVFFSLYDALSLDIFIFRGMCMRLRLRACDLSSLLQCIYDEIASAHPTFPSILLCTACSIIHPHHKVIADTIKTKKKKKIHIYSI